MQSILKEAWMAGATPTVILTAMNVRPGGHLMQATGEATARLLQPPFMSG